MRKPGPRTALTFTVAASPEGRGQLGKGLSPLESKRYLPSSSEEIPKGKLRITYTELSLYLMQYSFHKATRAIA